MRTVAVLVLLLALPLLHAELVQVIQLGRHGARTPNSFQFFANQFSEKHGELTTMGLVQEYFLGQEMRQRYVHNLKLLKEDFDPSEVVIKSSWKKRTIRSAHAFANGLYPQEGGVLYENTFAEHFPTEKLLPLKNREKSVSKDDIRQIRINEDWAKEAVEVISMDGDLYFHAAKDGNCPPAEKLIKTLKKGREFEEMEKYLRVALYPQLASIINKPLGFDLINPETLTIKQVKSILDNYRCNSFHGKLHPDFDEYTLKLMKQVRHFYAYKVMLVDDMVRSVSASKLLKEFMDYTQQARDQTPNTPKFIFYSAHDTTLEILFSIFLSEAHIDMKEHYNIIPFSSVVSLELHKEQDVPEGSDSSSDAGENYYIRFLFNDEPQYIKWCKDYKCSLSQFHRILDHYIVPTLENFCSAGRVVTKTSTPCADGAICEERNDVD